MGAEAPDQLSHSDLAEDLLFLSQRETASFHGRYADRPGKLGAYGAYNALTGDFSVSGLEYRSHGMSIGLDKPETVEELADFLASDHPLRRLEDQHYHLFDSQGHRLTAFEARTVEPIQVGREQAWMGLEEAGPEKLALFKETLAKFSSVSRTQLVLSPPESLDELEKHLNQTQDPRERMESARIAFGQRPEPAGAVVAQALEDLPLGRLGEVLEVGMEALRTGASVRQTLSVLLPILPKEQGLAAGSKALVVGQKPLERWAAKVLQSETELLEMSARRDLLQSVLADPTNPDEIIEPLAGRGTMERLTLC